MASYHSDASRNTFRLSHHSDLERTVRSSLLRLLHLFHVRWCAGDLLLVVPGLDAV